MRLHCNAISPARGQKLEKLAAGKTGLRHGPAIALEPSCGASGGEAAASAIGMADGEAGLPKPPTAHTLSGVVVEDRRQRGGIVAGST